jgi:archaellum component FlaC
MRFFYNAVGQISSTTAEIPEGARELTRDEIVDYTTVNGVNTGALRTFEGEEISPVPLEYANEDELAFYDSQIVRTTGSDFGLTMVEVRVKRLRTELDEEEKKAEIIRNEIKSLTENKIAVKDGEDVPEKPKSAALINAENRYKIVANRLQVKASELRLEQNKVAKSLSNSAEQMPKRIAYVNEMRVRLEKQIGVLNGMLESGEATTEQVMGGLRESKNTLSYLNSMHEMLTKNVNPITSSSTTAGES